MVIFLGRVRANLEALFFVIPENGRSFFLSFVGPNLLNVLSAVLLCKTVPGSPRRLIRVFGLHCLPVDHAIDSGRYGHPESHLGARWIRRRSVGVDGKDTTARDPKDRKETGNDL